MREGFVRLERERELLIDGSPLRGHGVRGWRESGFHLMRGRARALPFTLAFLSFLFSLALSRSRLPRPSRPHRTPPRCDRAPGLVRGEREEGVDQGASALFSPFHASNALSSQPALHPSSLQSSPAVRAKPDTAHPSEETTAPSPSTTRRPPYLLLPTKMAVFAPRTFTFTPLGRPPVSAVAYAPPNPRALLVWHHGLGEHAGRYTKSE
jgi:hypothetical protein